MKIGIYSGTFDPVHTGHTMLAAHIVNSGLVDEVWMLVSRLNPLKAGVSRPVSDLDRLNMCRIATKDLPHVFVDDTELHLSLPSYSYDTLSFLKERYPQHSFHLIVGADNIEVFDKWKNHDKILSEFGVLIYPRPLHELQELPAGARMIEHCPFSGASSTKIREAIAMGHNTEGMLSPDVALYITQHQLYRQTK